jgi:hypothetical protein
MWLLFESQPSYFAVALLVVRFFAVVFCCHPVGICFCLCPRIPSTPKPEGHPPHRIQGHPHARRQTKIGRAPTRPSNIESKLEGHAYPVAKPKSEGHPPIKSKPEGHAFTRAIKSHAEGVTALPKAEAQPEGRSDRSVAFIFLKNSPKIACQAPKPLKRNAFNHIAVARFPLQSGTINTGSKIRDKLRPKLFLI